MSSKLAITFAASARGQGEPGRPHMLFMMADQMRWDAMSHTAGPENSAFRTPNLDRLASEGLSVSYAYTSLPTCTPARASLLTGKSPWGHGMLGYGNLAESYPVELPRIFNAAGYLTGVIGKDHFGFVNSTTARTHNYSIVQLYDGLNHEDDYDRWFTALLPGKNPNPMNWNGWRGQAYTYDEMYHPTAWVGRNAVDFIQSHPNETDAQPFMLKVSFHRPHSPYDPPQRLLDSVSAEDLRPKKMCKGADLPANDGHGEAWCARFRGNASRGDPPGCDYGNNIGFCGVQPEPDHTNGRRAYAASVNFVDEWVGRIYDALQERNILERTWIIWTADHGDSQGDMFHMKKGTPYEFTARVPMLLRWPALWKDTTVARGTSLGAPIVAELRDVLHTFVDAAGLADNASLVPPSAFTARDGKSLLCLLRDPSGAACEYAPNPGSWRPYLDLEHDAVYNDTNHWSALTDGKMKYIFRAAFGDEQLFDLAKFPDESVEVSQLEEYGQELTLWRQRLVKQFEEEGRGEMWVVNQTLVGPRKKMKYGPNFPHAPSPSPSPTPSPSPPLPPAQAGDLVIMFANGGTAGCGTNDCWSSKALDEQRTGLELTDAPGLCLSASSGRGLDVQPCSAVDSQHFSDGSSGAIVHVPSGRCIQASKDSGDAVALATCVDGSMSQFFVFGSSGRLCAAKFGKLCVAVHHDETVGNFIV